MDSIFRKVIIITGASSGLGAASAIELSKYCPRLVLHGRNETSLEAVKQKCCQTGMRSCDIVTVLGDISDESIITKLVDTAKEAFGAIHVIFNNAGSVHGTDGPIHMGGTVEAMDAMYGLYVRAPYLLTQKSIPELEKTKGVVINCSSGLAKAVDPNLTAYSTNKAGLDHLTKLMALALGMRGIRVNSVNCGYVQTNIIERNHGADLSNKMFGMIAQGSPFEQRLASPEEIARVVVFLASDASAALHGENVYCDYGATLANPIVDFTKFK